jgi:hypothetical protein
MFINLSLDGGIEIARNFPNWYGDARYQFGFGDVLIFRPEFATSMRAGHLDITILVADADVAVWPSIGGRC